MTTDRYGIYGPGPDDAAYTGAFAPLPKAYEVITTPHHYSRFAIEPIRFICENKLDWFQGNVVKYVCRHDAKNGIEDLKKAARYLEMYIKFLQGDKDWSEAP